MASFRLLIAFSTLTGLLAAGIAGAADNPLVPPRPLELAPPVTERTDREALVVLRYTVKANGETADVEVVEGFTDQFFNQAAVSTVQGWRFTPGTNNGEAIDFLNQYHVLALRPTEVAAISPEVVEAYQSLSKQLDSDEFQEVATQAESLLQGNTVHTVLDYAFLNELLASAYIGLAQNARALAAIQRATLAISPLDAESAPLNVLPVEMLEVALRKRFVLAASLNQAQDAMRAFQRLETLGMLDGNDGALREQAAALQARLESTEPLGLIAGLDGNSWRYSPRHRIVAVTEVSSGDLDSLNVRCQRRTLQLDFEEGVEWNLPPALGQCELEFLGEPGTQFTLYEFAE